MIKLRIIEDYVMNPKDLERAERSLSGVGLSNTGNNVYEYNRNRVKATVDLNSKIGYVDVYSAKTWRTETVYTLKNIDSVSKVDEFVKNFKEILADVRSGDRYESFRKRNRH